MEIFGILILLGALGAVIFYLDLTDKVLDGFRSIGNGIETFILQLETAYNERRHIKKQKKQEAITAAFKKAADEKERVRQITKDWRERRHKQKDASDVLGRIRSRQEMPLEEYWKNHSESVHVGPHVTVGSDGGRSVKMNDFFSSPEVQRQLKGMERLFKGETLRALKFGKTPPNAVGQGRHTLESLKKEWNDEWQAVADDLNIDLFSKKQKVGSPRTEVVNSNITFSNRNIESAKKKIEAERREIEKIRAEIFEIKAKMKAATGTSGGPPR